MGRFFRRIQYVFRQRQLEAELAEELEAHRAMREHQLQANGVPPDEAARASRRALGNVTLAREDARGVWIWPWLESVWQDVVYALRVFRRAPGFPLAIVVVMALGIGSTTGVFSLLDGLILKSLPVRAPNELVYFWRPSFSYPVFQEVRARAPHLFSHLSAWDMPGVHVQWSEELEPTEVLTASGDFYQTLGIAAVAGRTFGPEDDRIGGGPQGLVAVLSHACWQQRFGGDPSAIGRTLRIDSRPFTIIGVTPPGFRGVTPGLAADITIPLTVLADQDDLTSHTSSWVHLLGRLQPGVSVEQADAAFRSIWPSILEATAPATMPADRRALYLSNRADLRSAHAGYSRLRTTFAEPLWTLLGLVGLLMIVACASAANLLLARSIARRREMAVRLAIGAGRGRLIRQMLTEAVVWSTIAAVLGLLFAVWSASGLVAMMTTQEERIVLDVTPNVRILGFALALAFLTAAVCAALPALRGTMLDPSVSLKGPAGATGGLLRRWSFVKTLVTVQVALTIVLLVGAALFVRSLQRVLSEDAGVERDRILVVATDPEAAGYEDDRLTAFYDRLLDRVRALPSVEAATISQYPPISDGAWTQSIEIDGVPLAAESSRNVHFNSVGADYFRTLGMRVVRGRDVGSQDTASSARVVAVNETLARRFFNGQDPIGRRISMGRNKNRRTLEVIAVVSDAKYQRLQELPRSIAYVPHAQLAGISSPENVFTQVRIAGPVDALAETVGREVRAIDPRVPVRVETVDDRIRQSLVRERVMTFLAGGLAVAALALACAALYGLLAYAVSRQSYEIGLRIALGAERRAVLWLVLRECWLLTMVGTAAGLAASLALGRYVRTFLFQISPTDSVAMAAAALAMIAVASLAGAIPARRAARVDPVVALRQE
jgi:predicted permease